MDTNAQFELHVEILNYFMLYMEAKNESITLNMLNELIAKMKQDMANLDNTSESQMIIDNFNRTLDYLKEKSTNSSSPFQGVEL